MLLVQYTVFVLERRNTLKCTVEVNFFLLCLRSTFVFVCMFHFHFLLKLSKTLDSEDPVEQHSQGALSLFVEEEPSTHTVYMKTNRSGTGGGEGRGGSLLS